eukprot:gene15868-biopygen6711
MKHLARRSRPKENTLGSYSGSALAVNNSSARPRCRCVQVAAVLRPRPLTAPSQGFRSLDGAGRLHPLCPPSFVPRGLSPVVCPPSFVPRGLSPVGPPPPAKQSRAAIYTFVLEIVTPLSAERQNPS